MALLALAMLPALAAPVTAEFEVDLRAEIAARRFDPARDAVGLRGAVPPLSWQASLPLQPLGEGRYGARVRFDEPPYGGQAVQHKFRIEKPGQGNDEGWEPGRNHAAHLEGTAPRIVRVFGADEAPRPSRHAGTVMELDPGPAHHAAARPVQVWLPPDYESNPSRRYPVLYLLDGQNVFDDRAAGAEWQVDEAAQRLALAGEITPPIVVAVPSGRDRLNEYTPTAGLMDAARRGGDGPAQRVGGGGPEFARYLLDDLKPAIDRRLRTKPEPAATAVGGASLGGLLALWIALHQSDRIGAALAVSPSVWWDERFAERDARQVKAPARASPRLWLDVGGQEGPGAAEAVRALRDVLQASGWPVAYSEAPQARHDELAWAERVPGMLKFLYGPDSPLFSSSPTERAP